MDTEFEGVRVDYNYSFYNHKNDTQGVQDIVDARGFPLPDSSVNVGYSKDFSIAVGIGGAEGRGHATFYAGYREADPILQAEFDYSACTLNLSGTGSTRTCGGSQTSDPAGFFVVTPMGAISSTAVCPSGGCVTGAGGILRPFTANDAFNFGPTNYYQRPDERYTAGVFANFKMSEKADVYGEMMFMDDRTVAQIAPSGSFFGQYALRCDNPYWSQGGAGTGSQFHEFCGQFGLGAADSANLLVGRRNTEGGGRQDDVGHESYRIVAGVRGELSDIFSYDFYVQHGETKRNSTYLNDFSIRRTGLALNAAPDGAGGAACGVNVDADPANDDANCVPWNIWQAGGVDPASLAYLQTPGFIRASARQEIAHFDVTADFSNSVKLRSTETGLAVNFGAEYRDEKTVFNSDIAFASGDLAGQGGATLPVRGRFDVSELFAEARLPLVEGMTGIQSLSIEAGYRFSDYSTGFSTDTYKAGMDWAPVDMLRFRGSYQRAVRAPNVGELFSSQSVALDGSQDPCAGILGNADGTDDPTATQAECSLTGMTAAQYGNSPPNPAGQYNGFLGGNPELTPETSDTISFGLVFRPEIGDLSVAIDYFNIEITDTISSTVGGNADTYINSCIDTGLPEFCDLVNRDSLGSLWLTPGGFIVDTSLNLGTLTTEGVDLQASYTLNFGEHRLGFNLVGTYLMDLSNAPLPGGESYDCTGFYGNTCGVPAAEWRHSFRANWRTPWNGLDVAATWRHFGDVRPSV